MISNNENNYDYLSCGLNDCCSTWAKRLVNNLPLSEVLIPPSEFLSFPEFGTLEKKKMRKESVGNYIEDCEFCGQYMGKTFTFYGKLVCEGCISLLKSQMCLTCSNINKYAEMFTNDTEQTEVPFNQRYIQEGHGGESNYCEVCSNNIKSVYKSDPILGAYYHSRLLSMSESEDDYDYYNRLYQDMTEETCQVCGDVSIDSSICQDCKSWVY